MSAVWPTRRFRAANTRETHAEAIDPPDKESGEHWIIIIWEEHGVLAVDGIVVGRA
jgi:hypothetical protein